jgi:hypothetical protein
MLELAEWDSFYLIVGSAAGALIGLQFVVVTLIAAKPKPPSEEAGAAFATPTIIHFSAAFVIAALVRAPWKSVTPATVLYGIIGIIGVVYTAVVTRRMRAQSAYKPVFEDWLFHALLPFIAYAILVLSTFAAFSYTRQALFAAGASVLLLLLIGIHNSWDAVTYNVFVDTRKPNDNDESEES